MIATETISFVLYTGEPDEVKSVEVLDIAGAFRGAAMTGHPVLTLRAMRDRRAEDVITGGLADFNRQVDASKTSRF
jgi:hypothetical protein